MQRSISSAFHLIGLALVSGLLPSPVLADDVSHSEARMLRESGKDDQGRVWELEFDATNGDLLELELDD